MISLSEALKELKELLKDRKLHYEGIVCYKDHVAEGFLEFLLEKVYQSFADSLEVEESPVVDCCHELCGECASHGKNQAIQKNQQLKKELLS